MFFVLVVRSISSTLLNFYYNLTSKDLYRLDRRVKSKRHIREGRDVSASTNVRSAKENGCRAIRGRIMDRSVLNAGLIYIRTNR